MKNDTMQVSVSDFIQFCQDNEIGPVEVASFIAEKVMLEADVWTSSNDDIEIQVEDRRYKYE